MKNTVPTLTIRSVLPAGRRRAGIRWPHEPVTVPAGSFSPEQIVALRSDPLLSVTPGTAVEEPVSPVDPSPSADPGPEGTPSGASDPGTGFDAETWQGAIRAGMLALDPENKAHWTKSGLPDLGALRAQPGLETVSAKERDDLWAELQAAKAAEQKAVDQPAGNQKAGDQKAGDQKAGEQNNT